MSTAADSLSSVSRKFYEDSRMKVAMSIVVAAGSMMLLGFCTIAGGNSASNTYLYKDATDKNTKNSYQNMAAGYAFATFAFILGFILLFAAAIYLSPLSCGSANEKTTIKNPLELPMGNAGAGAGSSAPTTSASAPRVGKLMQDEQI